MKILDQNININKTETDIMAWNIFFRSIFENEFESNKFKTNKIKIINIQMK